MKKQTGKIILIAALFTLFGIGIVLLMLFRNSAGKDNSTTPTQYVESNRYKLPHNMSYEYNEQEKSIILYGENFENPDKNTKYLQYRIMLKDTEEIIYKSKILQPGDRLESLSFPFDKDPGEYTVFLISATVSPNGSEEENAIMTPIHIRIK